MKTPSPVIAKNPLPAEFIAFIRSAAASPAIQDPRRIFGGLVLRWSLWRDGFDDNRLPGYAACPEPDKRTGFPAGWSQRLVMDICRETIGTSRIAKARRAAASLHS